MISETNVVRFMEEHPGRDLNEPIQFNARDVVLMPVMFDVHDRGACNRFLAAALAIHPVDVGKVKDWAEVVVNLKERTAAVIIFRPSAVEDFKAVQR